jgi:hypothetical protein
MGNKYKSWFWILAVLTSVLVFSLSYYGYQKVVEVKFKTAQIASLTDTVTLYKTKAGASGASRKIFVSDKDEVLQILKTSDKKAYNTVKATKDIHSYTDFSTSVKIDTTVKADVKFVKNDSTGKASVELTKVITEPENHYQADVSVKGDSVRLQVKMKDKYHILYHEQSNGFLKPKSYFVNVENENPYITIENVKGFEIKPKNKIKTGIKVGGVAIGLGLAAYFILR